MGSGLLATYLGEEVAEGYVRKAVQVAVQSKAHEKAAFSRRGLQLLCQVGQHPRGIQLAGERRALQHRGVLIIS